MNKYWFENEYCIRCPKCIRTSEFTPEECDKFGIIGSGRAEAWPYSCRLFGFGIAFADRTYADSASDVYIWWKDTIENYMKDNNPKIRIVISEDEIIEYDLRDCPNYTYDLVWRIDEDLSIFQGNTSNKIAFAEGLR